MNSIWAHHSYILQELMAQKIEGAAPDNLIFTFDPYPESNEGPFLFYQGGGHIAESLT